jgi:hypothetical protein
MLLFAAAMAGGQTITTTGPPSAEVLAWWADSTNRAAAEAAALLTPLATPNGVESGNDLRIRAPGRGVIVPDENTNLWLLVVSSSGDVLPVQISASPEVSFTVRTNRIAAARAKKNKAKSDLLKPAQLALMSNLVTMSQADFQALWAGNTLNKQQKEFLEALWLTARYVNAGR